MLSMPELLRRLALAVRCGALAHAVRCLSSGSSREKMAFPPPRVAKLALLVRMNGAWDCFAQKIACSACPASAELLCIRCEVHGDIYFLSRKSASFRASGASVLGCSSQSSNPLVAAVAASALPPSAASYPGGHS